MHSPEPGRSHDQSPVGAPGLLSLGDPRPGEALVASRIALIHRQQSLVAGHQRPCGGQNLPGGQAGPPQVQFRISGMSWPWRSMYWLCSMSLSRIFCLR